MLPEAAGVKIAGMWKKQDDLDEPPDDTLLWRYMDFTKLVSILEKRALFFCGLPSLEDPYEGVATRAYAEGLQEESKQLDDDHPLKRISPNVAAFLMESHIMQRGWVYVSCWHMNEIESPGMWSLYLKTNEGIAIRSRFSDFRESFAASKREIMGSAIRYVDFETALPDTKNIIEWCRMKRQGFEHEREFRTIAFTPPEKIAPQDGNAAGIYVPIDIDKLIETVFIAPHAKTWFADLVRSVLKRYGVDKEVRHSTLYQSPTYLNLGPSGVQYGKVQTSGPPLIDNEPSN